MGEAASRPDLRAGDIGATSRRAYDRIAPLYDLLDGIYETTWKRRLRATAFAGLRGRLLDVGVGTGCNMPFYPPGVRVAGIDASRAMLRRARRRAYDLGLDVRLLEMDLLRPEFPDGHFNAVVATFVFCCLEERDQLAGLRALRRLCRPGGEVRILDYALPDGPMLRLWMRGMTPWLRFAFAARYDAGTEAYIEAAGLRLVERRPFLAGAVRLLRLAPA